MSVRASLRWWWAGLAVSAAILSGLWIAEITVDLPRVDSLQQLIPGTIIPAAWMIAGLVAWRARPESKTGVLLVLIGCLYPANPLSYLAGDHAQWAFLMFGSINDVLLFWAVLTFPGVPLTWAGRVAVSLTTLAVLVGAASTGVKPRSDRCPVCPANPLPTAMDTRELSDALWSLTEPIMAVAAAVTAAVLIQRWRTASPPARRALAPMLWGTFQFALVHVYASLSGNVFDGRPGTITSYSFGLVPVGFMIGMLRTRQHHAVVADLVVELGSAPDPGRLEHLLARTLGDPSLQVAFWLPDRQTYVDKDGSPVEVDARRGVSVLRQGDEPLAALLYDPALLEDPKLLGAVAAAARLALENSRLQADLRARLHEIRESRVRLVTATDDERRRIERNLHDGAQQTLLGLRLAVRLARKQAADPQALDALLAEIDSELQAAVEELRTLARGVHPRVLSDEGLEPALAELARRAAIPTRIMCSCGHRLPPAVETAAYYVASEALANVLKHAHATRAEIAVARTDGRAMIEVSDDGLGGADPLGAGLRGLRDRVEALDGTLRIDSPARSGTRVRAEFPCA